MLAAFRQMSDTKRNYYIAFVGLYSGIPYSAWGEGKRGRESGILRDLNFYTREKEKDCAREYRV